MDTNVWKMPVPVTAIYRGPSLTVLPRRQCEIAFSIEDEREGERTITLRFEGVEAFKCTYLTALGSVDRDLFKKAYGNLIEVENSSWLREIEKARNEYHSRMPQTPKRVRHLMICFDDGPCYEIVCEAVEQT